MFHISGHVPEMCVFLRDNWMTQKSHTWLNKTEAKREFEFFRLNNVTWKVQRDLFYVSREQEI